MIEPLDILVDILDIPQLFWCKPLWRKGSGSGLEPIAHTEAQPWRRWDGALGSRNYILAGHGVAGMVAWAAGLPLRGPTWPRGQRKLGRCLVRAASLVPIVGWVDGSSEHLVGC